MLGSSFFGVLLAMVAPNTGFVSRGGKGVPDGLLAACAFLWAASQAYLGLSGALVGESVLV